MNAEFSVIIILVAAFLTCKDIKYAKTSGLEQTWTNDSSLESFRCRLAVLFLADW